VDESLVFGVDAPVRLEALTDPFGNRTDSGLVAPVVGPASLPVRSEESCRLQALQVSRTSTPKSRDGYVEALRVLRTARTSALKARTAVLAQISGVLAAAPEAVSAKYRGLTSPARAKAMAATRPAGNPADPAHATALTLKRMAARHNFLSAEISDTDNEIAAIVAEHAPALLEINGVGATVPPNY
jgi:predicted trehalose synthase